MVAGCYEPRPPSGLPCGTDGACPAPQHCDLGTVTCVIEDSVDAMLDSPPPPSDSAIVPTFAALHGQQWLMPCANAIAGGFCDCAEASQQIMVDGDPARTYDVTIQLRGVMEHGVYTGGTPGAGSLYVGGTQTQAILTTTDLVVSSPAQTYHVNSSSGNGLVTYDYQVTIPIDGGATIDLSISPGDGRCIANATAGVIPGVDTTPSPYLGQFGQVDVLSIN